MKFGLGMPGRNLDQIFKMAKDNGLTGLLTNRGQLGDVSPETFRDRVADAGLEIVQWGSWELNPLRPTDGAVAVAEENIRMAGRLGVPTIVMQPGSANPEHPFCSHAFNNTQEAMNCLVDVFSPLAKLAEDAETCIAVEIHFATALGTFERCAAFVEAVGSSALKIQMDGANMITFDHYWETGSFLETGFRILKDKIVMAHAKDVVMQNALHLHMDECPAGEGCMDYVTYLRLLEESLGPDGYLIIEHTPAEKLEAAVKHVRRCAEEAGL